MKEAATEGHWSPEPGRGHPSVLQRRRPHAALLVLLSAAAIAGCTHFPASGPLASDVKASASAGELAKIQLVDVDDQVARQLAQKRKPPSFADSFKLAPLAQRVVGRGDAIEIQIWESPPATLFTAGAADPRATATARSTTIPEQQIGQDGMLQVPFAGRVPTLGRSLAEVEEDITRRLSGKANQPQVMLRLTKNASATVAVVGEVVRSLRLPLSPAGETLLDALAEAGGSKQPVNKVSVQLTRGRSAQTMPLDAILLDPQQNIPLQAGDVVTLVHQPYSFTALGATGRNEEVNFETQGINLAQALARSGGLTDSRASPEGVFVFRFERADALAWARQPVATTPEGLVPVVYRINLRDPGSFFVMQNFSMNTKDVLYVSNAPVAELQKFLNVVFSIAYPLLTAVQASK
jgi:polysaccharide export outer membrane protein